MGRNVIKRKIINTSPWMMEYLVNKEDGYRLSHSSKEKVMMQCLRCGHKRMRSPKLLGEYGIACPKCGDGISYANKLMFNILEQLNIDFQYEISQSTQGFEWIPNNYRYDFYFQNNNIAYFVEMDGHYHMFCKKTKYRDIIKNQLAQEHNIQMIRIPCNYDRFVNRLEFIKDYIFQSILPSVLCFEEQDIDWQKCDLYANSSLVIQVCTLWNNGMHSTLAISEVMPICRLTVGTYLQIGTSLGLCDYDPQIEHDKILLLGRTQENEEKKCKPIAVYNSFGVTHIFKGATYLSANSERLFGWFISRPMITNVCNGHVRSCRGLMFKYISKQEYKQYFEQFNGEINPNNNIVYVASSSLYKPVAIYNGQDVIQVFISCDEAAEVLSEKYSIVFKRERIKSACLGQQKQYHNLKFKHITKEEYEKYKIIKNKNNEVVLKKEGDVYD